MKLKDNRGSALMVVLIIVVVLALGGTGYWVWHKNKNSKSTNSSTTSTQSNTQTSTTNPSPSPSTSQTQQSTTTNPCSDLAVSKGTYEGTAGTFYYHVVITNDGSSDCKLSGYPKTAVMTDGTMSQTATNKNLYPTSTITLAANGGKAHVVMGLPDAGNYPNPSSVCTTATKTKLNLTFTGVPSAISAAFNVSACKGLTVTTIQSGA